MTASRTHMAAPFVVFFSLLAPINAQESAAGAPLRMIRTPLATIDFQSGHHTVTGFAQLASGACAGRHTHPGIESSYILEGDFTLNIDGKPEQHLKPGDSFQIPPAVPHDGCATAGTVKIFTVHVVEQEKPLSLPVP